MLFDKSFYPIFKALTAPASHRLELRNPRTRFGHYRTKPVLQQVEGRISRILQETMCNPHWRMRLHTEEGNAPHFNHPKTMSAIRYRFASEGWERGAEVPPSLPAKEPGLAGLGTASLVRAPTRLRFD